MKISPTSSKQQFNFDSNQEFLNIDRLQKELSQVNQPLSNEQKYFLVVVLCTSS